MAASDQAIARADAAEARAWRVTERRRLRGRPAATVVSVPAPREDAAGRLAPTPAGHEALVEWTRSALARRAVEHAPFDLALLTAHCVPVTVARDALAARLAELDDLTSQLTTRIRTSARRGLSEEYWMQADYRRHQLLAEFTWLSRLLERVESGELTWTVGQKPAAPPETA